MFGYDSGGRLTSIDRTIAGAGTSVNTSLVYDAGEPSRHDRRSSRETTGLATFVYGYDSGNRLTSENDTEIAGGVTYTYNATYAYDHANELTGVTATLDGGAANESYAYDSGGNRNTTGYTAGGDNALTASPGYTYTYDNEGNMTAKTQTSTGDVWTYGYDDRNRLTAVIEKSSGGSTLNQATYIYDVLDRRIGIDDNSTQTWTVYDGSNPYADFTGAGSLATRYLSGAAVDELFARTSAGGTSAWYLTDNLGSVRDVVNSSGSVLDHLAYDSFGNITVETSSSSGDRFKYAGLQWDERRRSLSRHSSCLRSLRRPLDLPRPPRLRRRRRERLSVCRERRRQTPSMRLGYTERVNQIGRHLQYSMITHIYNPQLFMFMTARMLVGCMEPGKINYS